MGLVAIAMIFARTWPFLRPYVLGYWQEIPFRQATETDAKAKANPEEIEPVTEWSFRHIPPLVTMVAAMGPVSGIVPLNTSWLFDFLLISILCMAVLSWSLLFVKQSL